MIQNVDMIQRFKVGGIFLLQVYKVITGTMMSLFIPQSCGNEICTLQENYDNTEVYHKTVLYWNMFTCLSFMGSYILELRREEWAIKYLDINNDYPDNSLKEIIINEPLLDQKMDRLNKYYYRGLQFTGSVYCINLLLTIKMINDNYHSSSTLSCFVSFSLLVLMKLYNSLDVAHKSITSDKMMSAFMSEFVSFNVLDEDYVKKKSMSERSMLGRATEECLDIEKIVPEVK